MEIELLDGQAAREREPALPPELLQAAFKPDGRPLNAHAYTTAVAAAAQVLGAAVYPGRPVTGLAWSGDRVVRVQTEDGDLHGPSGGQRRRRLGRPHRSSPEPSGVPGARTDHGGRSAAGQAAAQRVACRRLRLRYPSPDGRVVVGATREAWGFAKRVTPDGLASLSATVTSVLPVLESQPILGIWSGLRPGTIDALPTLGLDPCADGGFLWETGHYSSGMMQMPTTTLTVADLALGREPRLPIDPVSL